MFDYIKVEGFRSFKSVELEMPRLAVLIGPNGGGKSNFLDLMSLMAEAGQGHLANGIDSRGGFRSVAFGFDLISDILTEFRFQVKSLPEAFPSLPPDLSGKERPDVRFKMGLTFGFTTTSKVRIEEVTEEPTARQPHPVSVMTRGKDGCVFRSADQGAGPGAEETKALESESELAIFQVRDLYRYPTPYKLLKQFQEWTLYRDINVGPEAPARLPALLRPTTRLSENGANLSPVLHTIKERHHETWTEIVEVLHTACPVFQDIRIPGEGGDGKVVLRWFEEPYEKEGVSANFLSDGTLKLLCLVAILKSPDPPPLICIDEPELGLHPDWIKMVAELLQDAADRTQVIVATHSPHIVEGLEPDQIIVTEKENGETRLERLSTKDLEKWLKDFNLADLWLAGHFGGRP
ncbi:MAG TPA: AAA family ATPase [Terriglobia bacterium]|nr:AAA family ATPase [Terriglobia bacterium]